MAKQRATLDRQIETLRRHGVTFNIRSEDRARSFLARNTYFFKLKSYENNYDKHCTADDYVYLGLDFEYLVEMSLIDFSLSRLMWSMCSNIEHALKVDLNGMLMEDADPDVGDKCFKAWEDKLTKGTERAKPIFDHDNPYTNDLRNRCGADFAVWHVWEMASFNQQVWMYNIGHKLIRKAPHPLEHVLVVVVKMRNAVSHGNCLMTDLRRPAPRRRSRAQTDVEITRAAMDMCERRMKSGSRLSSFQKSLDTLVVNNFAAVLLSHLSFVKSSGVLRHCQQEVSTFIDRVERNHQEYFGDRGAARPRNQVVDQTLRSLVTLAQGYLRGSAEKAHLLDPHEVVALP